MKKYVLSISVLVLIMSFFYNCEKDNLIFDQKDGIYFVKENANDSIYYSFIGKLEETQVLQIPIRVMGDASDTDRTYKMEVDLENTTAQEGLHYEKLKDEYIFKAGNFSDNFEIVLSNQDPLLETESRVITLNFLPSKDFDLGYTDKTSIKVYITNQLIKPNYWDNLLFRYFNVYSKVKHNIAINIMGHDFPPTRGQAISSPYGYVYFANKGRVLADYFSKNEVYDENGNRIYTWPPF